jgi:hypothetical protein
MSDEAKTTEAKAETAPAQPQTQGPDLTIQDLNALKNIIDVASQRGAFKPSEMMTVGQTYTKLEQFLAAVAAQQAQGPQGG